MIQSYSFGRIVIGEKTYTSDIILLCDGIQASWRRRSGHRLSLKDLSGIAFQSYEVFIVGTGAMGLMKVDQEVEDFVKAKDIELIIEKTKQAVRKYNEISATKKTVAAFHLTC